MKVHTYMLFVGTGQNESDDRAAVTFSAEKIVQSAHAVTLFGPDGKHFAKLVLEPGVKIRVVGE
jgi:hypothetical protein